MSSDMANPPIFDSDAALMASAPAQGNGYSPYPSIYGNMAGQGMNFSHQPPYQVQNPGTPTSLPPMHPNSAYSANPNNNNFQFSYHGDAGSAPQPPPVAGAPGPNPPLATPSGAQTTDPLDSGAQGHGTHQHSPHSHQSQAHQLTPPQQHPQTPQQQQQQSQHQQQQQQQRQAQQQHQNATPSPYQQPTSQANHPGMGNMMHGHPIYPGDNRYDRLPQQRYMDPNMQPMLGRSNSRSGDMPWTQPGMMPDLMGAGGAVRNPAGVQGRAPTKQNMAGLNNMGGMGMNGMNMGMGAGLGGMPGMAGLSPMGDRMGWGGGGLVGAPTSPYGHPQQHAQQLHQQQQQFHHGLQAHPYQQQQPHMMQHPQGLPPAAQHMGNHGRIGSMGPAAGGGIKKKAKRPTIPVVKDKNCPKRPRNSYIFFTLMKRDDIKKKHPEFKPTEITKMLGEEWQKLSESEKESYGSMAENDKKRYQSEMESYDANGGAAGAAAAAAAAESGGHNQGGHGHNHSHSGGMGTGPPGGHGGDLNEHWRG